MKGFSNNYWAERAKRYDKTNWVKNENFIDAFLGLLPKNKFNKILEVGIGTGAVAEIVSERIGSLIGIDISQEMISKIKHTGIKVILADAHDLPFDDKSFDLVYMRNVIHYIDIPALSFSEIYRCLKKNGYFLFSQVVPPNDSLSKEYDWLIGRAIHYPSKNEILELFEDFKILKQREFILEKQSIMNWLNNTCYDENKKEKIIQRHRKTSKIYKSLVHFEETADDILLNIKNFMVLAHK